MPCKRINTAITVFSDLLSERGNTEILAKKTVFWGISSPTVPHNYRSTVYQNGAFFLSNIINIGGCFGNL